MAVKEIEYVITYKLEPLSVQREETRKTQQAANEFAFQVEVDGGVAVVTCREKKNPVNRNDMWIDSF